MVVGGQPIRLAAILAILAIGFLFYFVTIDQLHTDIVPVPNLKNSTSVDWLQDYIVNGPFCKIPNTNPFDPTIIQYLTPTRPVICSEQPLLTTIRQHQGIYMVTINETLLPKFHEGKAPVHCCYSIIKRISQSPDKYDIDSDKIYRIGTCHPFVKQASLPEETEFIIVTCKSNKKVVYTNAHAWTPMKQHIRNRQEPQTELSVLIIGIDSVSRLSLQRTMPTTLDHLLANNWFELQGYNKIADNTFPNLMAILSGQRVNQLGKCMQPKMKQDVCPIIWNDFRNAGYATAYAEDVPALATFNYKKAGFVQEPTDYYMRPFMLATHAILNVKNKDGLPICIGPQSAADHVFGYAKHFVETFQFKKYFGLFWLNSFSHNNVNSPGALDKPLTEFLNDLKNNETYNNSLILILSDHGIRFGPIRNTFVGFLEERLPFFFMHLPKWFADKYPNKIKNLQTNKNRLTSPFDVYVTLNEILGTSEIPPKGCPSCQSLFEEIPESRNCQNAGIDEHWCMCSYFYELPTNNSAVQMAGQFLYEKILKNTRELAIKDNAENLCEERQLKKIVRAHLRRSWNHPKNQKQTLLIILETEPFGLFEATVLINATSSGYHLEVLGFISRLDSYLTTTKCLPMNSSNLQLYCHCYNS